MFSISLYLSIISLHVRAHNAIVITAFFDHSHRMLKSIFLISYLMVFYEKSHRMPKYVLYSFPYYPYSIIVQAETHIIIVLTTFCDQCHRMLKLSIFIN